MSSSDQDGHPTEPNEAEKQSDADREPNKFRPFRALTYFLRSAQRKYRTKDKRKRLYSFAHDFTIASQDWIALAWQRCKNFFEYAIADIGTGISVSISTFIQILGWFRRGVCRIVNSNRIIAAFTAVMAGTTYFQWQAMERQSEQIQQQLRHSETALGQTDKTLDFMELGQRPWLSVVTPEITERFQDTKRIQCRMSCKNTGPTPGKIVRHRLATFLLPAITSAEDVLAHYEKIAIEIQEPNTVPPEGGMNLEFTDTPILDHPRISAIAAGSIKLYIVGELFYTDPFDKTHRTAFFFEYHPVRGEPKQIGRFLMRSEYSDMN